MKTALPIVAWVMIALAVLVSFRIDWNNTAQGGAIDFRNRITGARLLVHGIDPYHYKWREADPPEFCDPSDNPNRPVSRTTITPALLSLYPPLAELPYRVAQFVWLGLQWALLLGTGVLWWQACRAPTLRWLVVVAVVGFSFTAAWRLHAERGQCYVPLTFFLAWWLTATLDPLAAMVSWRDASPDFSPRFVRRFFSSSPFSRCTVAASLSGPLLVRRWVSSCRC